MNRKVGVVIRRELWSTIRRPGWMIGTFGMPVFVGLYAGLVFLVTSLSGDKELATGKAGIVDRAGVVRFQAEPVSPLGAGAEIGIDPQAVLPEGLARDPTGLATTVLSGTQFLPFGDEESALEALARKEIGAVYVLPADYLATGKVTAYDASRSILSEGKLARAALRKLLIQSLTAETLGQDVAERIFDPLRVTTLVRSEDGAWVERGLTELARRLGVPLAFTVMLLISILVSAGTLIEGVSEEKESRIIEIILSSIDARSLLLGKLVGLGAAGLLQLAIWLTMAIAPLALLVAGLVLSPLLVLVSLAYFLLGFLLYGTLITATGVLATTSKNMQQVGMFWAIGIVPPMLFLEVLLRQPAGTTARILSYIPFTSPTTMMLRFGIGGVPMWELLLTLVLLAAWVWVVLRFAARIFRTGLLMYGKRPTVTEIFRWLREA